MTAVLFSGQGTQKKGMGEGLFQKYPSLVKESSDALGFSIEELCLKNPGQLLDKTEYAQPALFFVNMLAYLDNKHALASPSYFLGHSLGEYNALCAAGAFDIITGVRLVHRRGQFMAQAAQGGMVAVLGVSKGEIVAFLERYQFSDLDIANHNSPSQIVLSGPKERILACAEAFTAQGLKAIVLNVAGAFHSRYMEAASGEFSQFLRPFVFSSLQVPVIANVTAKEYPQAEIKALLAQQLSHSVRWSDSIQYVLAQGVSQFHEVQSQILSKMVQEIQTIFTPVSPLQKKTSKDLGSSAFCEQLGVKYAYVSGSMYRGIASPAMVVRMAQAGLLSFYGVGGLSPQTIEDGIAFIKSKVSPNQLFGLNLLANYINPEAEMMLVHLLLKHQITMIEAAAFVAVTPALALYVIKGLYRDLATAEVKSSHRVFAKISRLATAQVFMDPIPELIIKDLLAKGAISQEEAQLAKDYPVSCFLCLEGDSGGHTDRKQLFPLLIGAIRLREEKKSRYGRSLQFFIGAAGGLGDPLSIGLSFSMGADFVLTGSVNQCSVEAGTSDLAKDLLQQIDIEDTEYTIAADMFEMGAKVQVLKKGVLYPARANRLFSIYSLFSSLEEIPGALRNQIEEQYFRLSFPEVERQVEKYFGRATNPKWRMAVLFRWYLHASDQWAIAGQKDRLIDYQIHTGPALGLFNQWLKGSGKENWRERHVDWIAETLMENAKEFTVNR